MRTYIFHEPGCIPGVPGTFAHCQVTVNDDGTVDIQPLAQQPHEPANTPAAKDTTTAPQDESTAKATPPESRKKA